MSENKGSGCLKTLFIILLVLAILIGGLTYWAVNNAGQIGQYFLEQGTMAGEAAIVEVLKDADYTEEEIARIIAPVKEFNNEIRAGKVDMAQGLGVFKQIIEGPVFALISLSAFEKAYVNSSFELSDEQKEQARIDISRYLHGVSEGSISNDETKNILNILQEEVSDGSGETQSKTKDKLTKEEIFEVLSLVKTRADEAQIEKRYFKFDLAKEIENAIAKGKENPITSEGEGVNSPEIVVEGVS